MWLIQNVLQMHGRMPKQKIIQKLKDVKKYKEPTTNHYLYNRKLQEDSTNQSNRADKGQGETQD